MQVCSEFGPGTSHRGTRPTHSVREKRSVSSVHIRRNAQASIATCGRYSSRSSAVLFGRSAPHPAWKISAQSNTIGRDATACAYGQVHPFIESKWTELPELPITGCLIRPLYVRRPVDRHGIAQGLTMKPNRGSFILDGKLKPTVRNLVTMNC